MAAYDLLMLAILAGLTIYGYFKGLAWQLAYITSLVASYFVAVRFSDQFTPAITTYLNINPPLNKFVAMLIIYAATSLVIWMVFRLVRGFIDKVKLEAFDRQMGAVAGLFRGALWCVAVTFLVVTLLPQGVKQMVIDSKSGRYIARVLDETDSLFPPEVHQVIGPYLDRLENELNGTAPANPYNAGPFGGQAGGGQSLGWPGQTAQQPAPSQPAANPFSGIVQGFAQQAASQFAPQQQQQRPTYQQPAQYPQTATGNPTASQLGWPQR